MMRIWNTTPPSDFWRVKLCILQRYSVGLTVKWRQGSKGQINNTKCKLFGHWKEVKRVASLERVVLLGVQKDKG